MKKIKYIIVILIFIVAVLIGILLIHKSKIKRNESIVNLSDIQVTKSMNSIGYKEYFTVSNCISQYLDVINKNNSSYYSRDENGNPTLVVTSKQVAENIMGLISDEYKNTLNINESNIFSRITPLSEKNILTLTSVKKLKEGNVIIYIAKGFTTKLNNEFLRDVNFIVNIDKFNYTFSIEELQDNVDFENITRDSIESIEKNKYNSYADYSVREEDTINKHISAYKKMMLAKPELAYEYLDEEYRNKRFGSIEKFYEYINRFQSQIETLSMKKYKINSYDDYKEYIIIDADGKYYRFRENGVMDYTVMLDVYTIDLPQYVQEFNNGDENKKVGLCIERFLQMVNAEDYESAYKLLDETYRQNNFDTLNKFTEYIQGNFNYANNLKSIDSLKKEGKYYIITVSIENAKFPLTEPIQRSFVIRLEEGTSFKMSISLE